MGKYSKHNSYYYGENEVPSVTTILKIIAKPALVKWANIMGFKRQKVEDILEEKSYIGSFVHDLIESWLKGRYIIRLNDYYKEIGYRHFAQFHKWYKKHNVEMEFVEESFSSEKFGGTVDFYGIVDGKKTIVDFKTSKTFYSSMFLQLGAYVYLLELQGYEVEQVGILCINTERHKFKTMTREEIQKYMDIFMKFAELFELWYAINHEDGWGDILGK